MRPKTVQPVPPGAGPAAAPASARPDPMPLLRALAGLPGSWMILQDIALPPIGDGQAEARLPALLLHPGFGIVLLEFEPADTPDAVARFRLRLRETGLREAERALLPVLHLRIRRERADRLGLALERVLAERGVAPGAPDLPWVRPVLQALRRGPVVAPPPVPEEAVPPSRRGVARSLWLAAILGSGAGAAALYMLAAGDAELPSPPRIEAARATMPDRALAGPREVVLLATLAPPDATAEPPPDRASAAGSHPVEPASYETDPAAPEPADVAGMPPALPDIPPAPPAPDGQAVLAALAPPLPGEGRGRPPPGMPAPLHGPAPPALFAKLPSLLPPAPETRPLPAIVLAAAVPMPAAPGPPVIPAAVPPHPPLPESPALPDGVPAVAGPPLPVEPPPDGEDATPDAPVPAEATPLPQAVSPSPVAEPPPVAPTRTVPPPAPVVLPPPVALPPALLTALLRRGGEMLAVGDISAARLLYERAASAGSGAAALALGRTHDPATLAALGAQGPRPDPEAAAVWYRRALALGEPGAAPLLRALGAPHALAEGGKLP